MRGHEGPKGLGCAVGCADTRVVVSERGSLLGNEEKVTTAEHDRPWAWASCCARCRPSAAGLGSDADSVPRNSWWCPALRAWPSGLPREPGTPTAKLYDRQLQGERKAPSRGGSSPDGRLKRGRLCGDLETWIREEGGKWGGTCAGPLRVMAALSA